MLDFVDAYQAFDLTGNFSLCDKERLDDGVVPYIHGRFDRTIFNTLIYSTP